jgi:DNA-binding FadR family transcriptional regulator
MFEKVKQNRIFQDVVEQIQNAILDGRLKKGEKLPPERELKEMFHVSRGTLRESLRVLEQKGLIEIRIGVGGGAFVRQASALPLQESLGILLRSQTFTPKQLGEFRSGMEANIASLAALRCTPKNGDRLKQLLEDAKNALEPMVSWDRFLETDEAIHQELANIAGNPVYLSVQQTIHTNIHPYYDRYLPRDESLLRENYQDLCEIVDAVLHGRQDRAAELIRDHVVRFEGYMAPGHEVPATPEKE